MEDEEQPKINLRQYQPKKGKRSYLIKSIIYAIIIVLLLFFITLELVKQKDAEGSHPSEIQGVTLDSLTVDKAE